MMAGIMAATKRKPNYLDQVIALREQLGEGVHHVVVDHDGWCAHWRGGVCDCRPEVTICEEMRAGARGDNGTKLS